MNRKNMTVIRDATSKAVAAQVHRTLDVMRIKGWEFPSECDIAVNVHAATALVTQVSVRMDDIIIQRETITPARAAEDVERITDALVASWFVKHATARPKRAG